MNIKTFFWNISKHKSLELDFMVYNPFHRFYLIRFELDYKQKVDHAGILFSFSLLNFYFGIHFYDSRHWDEENDTWHKYIDPDYNIVSALEDCGIELNTNIRQKYIDIERVYNTKNWDEDMHISDISFYESAIEFVENYQENEQNGKTRSDKSPQ